MDETVLYDGHELEMLDGIEEIELMLKELDARLAKVKSTLSELKRLV